MKNKYHLITTAHRGVFVGLLKAELDGGKTVILTQAINVIKFGTTGGFLQLAATGPTTESKLGTRALEITLFDVTSKTKCSKAASTLWDDSSELFENED
jgi:hypothetical protein